jgi:hypothetical protein
VLTIEGHEVEELLSQAGRKSFGRGTHDHGFEDETRERIRTSDTEREQYKRIFGFVSGLERVIPGIEGVGDWTNNTGHQDESCCYP